MYVGHEMKFKKNINATYNNKTNHLLNLNSDKLWYCKINIVIEFYLKLKL